MFQTKPYGSFEDASRRAFESHVNAAPVALPIVLLCLAGLIGWNPPSAWFVLLNIAGGSGLAVSWACQMRGHNRGALVAALASLLLALCGLVLDIDRDFILQLGQGLGLISLPFYISDISKIQPRSHSSSVGSTSALRRCGRRSRTIRCTSPSWKDGHIPNRESTNSCPLMNSYAVVD